MHVGCVTFSTDTVIATRHDPVGDPDVPSVPDISSIGVDSCPPGRRGGIHVEVGHLNVLRICDKGVPELGLPPGNTVHQDISSSPDCQADRPARLVAFVLILVIPSLTVPKEERLPSAAVPS